MSIKMRLVVGVIAAGAAVLFSAGARAAEGDLAWAGSFGNTGLDVSNGIATDASGNVYTTGWFAGTVDFDTGPGVLNLTAPSSSAEIYVRKADSYGNLIWARAFTGNSFFFNFGYGIAVDSSGNVYTTGNFSGTVDFDPGAGTVNSTAVGGSDVFVSKLDSNGDFVWVRTFGASNIDEGRGITLDSAGAPHVAGMFSGTVDFDPGVGTTNLVSAGGTDAFVLKLDSAGDFTWAKRWGSTQGDEALAIALDNAGDVYTTGRFRGTVDLDPGAGTDTFVTPSASFDVFVSKLDLNGDYVWAAQLGGATNDRGLGIVCDGAGNVYATGEYTSTADFDPDGVGTLNFTAAGGSTDMYVWALDAAGALNWAMTMGDVTSDNGRGIALDLDGNLLITGGYSGTPDFDPGAGVATMTTAGNFDVYVLKLDNAGAYQTAYSLGGTVVDEGNGVVADPAGNVLLAGRFNGTADFDPGAGVFNLVSAGSDDAFVAKYAGSDIAGPNAVTITASPVGPTNVTSVVYTVTFDEVVLDFDDVLTDVTLGTTGSAAYSGAVLAGGPTVYTVTVSGISGDGSLSVAANTGSDVVDLGGNALASSVTGTVFIDNTGPVASGVSANPATASAGQVVEISFSLNETAAGDPDVTVNGNVAVRTAKGGPVYVYEYTLLPGDPLGAATIVMSSVDALGNAGLSADMAALTIVAPVPNVPLAAWPLGVVMVVALGAALRRRR